MALLASTSTLDEMHDTLTRFYCGESKALMQESDDIWRVCFNDTGMPLIGVRVRKYRNRYRFETVL